MSSKKNAKNAINEVTTRECTVNLTKRLQGIGFEKCTPREPRSIKKVKKFAKQKMELINILDDDCLSIILSYLQPFELVEMKKVCQRWQYVVELAWIFIKKFEYTNGVFGSKNNWQLINFNQLEYVILKSGRYLTHLTLKNLCGSEIVPLIRDHCRNLVRLELVLNQETYCNDFDDAFTKMHQLNYISIDVDSPYNYTYQLTYDAIPSLHSSINEIHLPFKRGNDRNVMWDSESFLFYIRNFNNLQALTFPYQFIDDDGMSIILNFKKLLHLSLSNSEIDNHWLIKLSNLINLEYLDLSYVNEVDDRVVLNIANNCCKLKYLNLKKCSLVTGNSINKLIQLINLEHLFVEKLNLNKNCIYNIANNCKNLKSLNISESKNVKKSDIMKIAELKFLEHLELCNLKSVDDYELINIIHNSCNLKYLDIKKCFNITKNALVEIIIKLKKLQTLIVIGVQDINDQFISRLRNLKYLNCSETKVTDIGIKKVIKNCPSIEKLSVCRTKITVDSLFFAAQETNKRSTNIILTIEVDIVIKKKYNKNSQTGSNVLLIIKGL